MKVSYKDTEVDVVFADIPPGSTYRLQGCRDRVYVKLSDTTERSAINSVIFYTDGKVYTLRHDWNQRAIPANFSLVEE